MPKTEEIKTVQVEISIPNPCQVSQNVEKIKNEILEKQNYETKEAV
jgi:hypothetical protein